MQDYGESLGSGWTESRSLWVPGDSRGSDRSWLGRGLQLLLPLACSPRDHCRSLFQQEALVGLPGVVSCQISQLNWDYLILRLPGKGGIEGGGGRGAGTGALFVACLPCSLSGQLWHTLCCVCSESTSCKIRIWGSSLSAAAQVFKSRLDWEPVSFCFDCWDFPIVICLGLLFVIWCWGRTEIKYFTRMMVNKNIYVLLKEGRSLPF